MTDDASERVDKLERELAELRRQQDQRQRNPSEMAGVLMNLYGISTILAALCFSIRIIAEDGFWAWALYGWFVACIAGALWPLWLLGN